MTDGHIIACLFIVCGGAIGGAAAYCLHMRTIMRDILRDEREQLRIWARNHAEMMAQEQLVDMLRHLRVTVPVTLVNESDIDWGDGKEKAHDAEHETLAA